MKLCKYLFSLVSLLLCVALLSVQRARAVNRSGVAPNTSARQAGTQSGSAQDVSCDTGTGVLHGTLELPASKPPFPVTLIIAGSGPTDRDGNSPLLQGHNDSLKMIAQALAAHGIASLRYDKRGVAASKVGGLKEEDLRFETFVNDTVQWGEYLRKDSRFSSLVIAGHSEGSLIGMLAAAKLGASGYISIAGQGLPAAAALLEQFRSNSVPADLMKQTEDIVKELDEGRQVQSVPPVLKSLFRPSVQPYLISYFKYDPAREITKLKMPVLILLGTTDIQVSVNAAKLLASANPSSKLVVIEGINHLLKEVPADRTKQIASYSDPSLPVSPRLLDEMISFISGLKPHN